MKCPLLTKYFEADTEVFYHEPTDCIKEECAWWSQDLNQCDPTGLIATMKEIWHALDSMTAHTLPARE